jgi:hypothetical protein
MGGIITTGNVPKALWPGVKAWWGRFYDEHPKEYPDLFEMDTSSQAFEEDVQVTGFGLPVKKNETVSVYYDSEKQGGLSRYQHTVKALGYMVTWEETINNLYEKVAKRRTQALAFSMRQGHEITCANTYNRGFDTNYPGWDAVPLFSLVHPTESGSQANKLTTDVDICETALEDLVTLIGYMKNDKGLAIALNAVSLHIPVSLWFEANRILKSVLQNDSALNAENVLRATGAFPGGIKINHYFTDTDAYFIRTNCPRGMIHYQRVPVAISDDNDFDTENMKYKAMDYYSQGWTDWRGVVGSSGG